MRKTILVAILLAAGAAAVLGAMLAEAPAGALQKKNRWLRQTVGNAEAVPLRRILKTPPDGRSGGPAASSQATVLWEDDFEGSQPPWIPAASWTNVPVNSADPNSGFVFGNHSGWAVVDTISQDPPSPTRAWHNDDNEDTGIDLLISPVIHLPKTSGGEPLLKALVSFYLDLHAPDVESGAVLQDFFFVRAGRADALWSFDNAAPFHGPSHWALRQDPSDAKGAFNVQAIVTPELDLAGTLAPILTFAQQYLTELHFDYCAVDASIDAFATYRTLASSSGNQTTYESIAVNLSDYAGQKIRLRFRFISDYFFTQPGARWFIDDIAVKDGTRILFSDDGGDNGSTVMAAWGFVGGDAEIGLDFDKDPNNPAAVWEKIDSTNIDRGRMDLLASAAGVAPGDSVRLAIHWVTNGRPGAGDGRGIFIDDVKITAVSGFAHDVAMVDADVPFPNLDAFAAQSALGRVRNRGFAPQSAVPIRYRVNDGPTQTPVPPVTLSLAADEEAERALNWLAPAPGTYQLSVFTALPQDGDRDNDTLSLAPITVYPNGTAELGYDDRFNQNVFVTALTCLVNFSVLQDLRGLAQTYALHSLKIDFFNRGTTADQVRLVVATAKDDTTLDQILFEKIEPVPAQDFSSHFLEVNAQGLSAPRLAVLVDFSVSNGNALLLMDGNTRFTGHNFFFDGVKWSRSDFGRQIRTLVSWLAPPKIVFVRDVPRDQGKQVQVCWFPPPSEAFSRDIANFVLWREVKDFGAADSNFRIIEVPNLQALYDYGIQNGRPGDRVRIAGDGAWDFIVSVPSHPGFEAYCYVAPTLVDSNATGANYTAFMVTAYDQRNAFADSKVDSGYSVDNIAPHTPPGFAASRVEVNQRPAVQLTWKAVEDEDLAYYAVYKNGSNSPLVQTVELDFTDLQVAVGATVRYSLVAFDVNGNRSPSANVTLTVTGVAERPQPALPTAYALGNNYPNPFNPHTAIDFALPKAGHVQLAIFNFLGQEIATLVDAEMPAGFHRTAWQAKHQTSGIYFYRMTVNDFTQIKKMVLMQ